jgi:hypothetical protein
VGFWARPRSLDGVQIPLALGLFKINVDASASRSEERGPAAVVIAMGFTRGPPPSFKGVTDPTTLEALACREALALAEAWELTESLLLQIARW